MDSRSLVAAARDCSHSSHAHVRSSAAVVRPRPRSLASLLYRSTEAAQGVPGCNTRLRKLNARMARVELDGSQINRMESRSEAVATRFACITDSPWCCVRRPTGTLYKPRLLLSCEEVKKIRVMVPGRPRSFHPPHTAVRTRPCCVSPAHFCGAGAVNRFCHLA
jgi:hypothetical protein